MKHLLLIILLLPSLSYSIEDRDKVKAAYDQAVADYDKAFKEFIRADRVLFLSMAERRKTEQKLNQAIIKLDRANKDMKKNLEKGTLTIIGKSFAFYYDCVNFFRKNVF